MGLQRLRRLEAREAVVSGRTFQPDPVGSHLVLSQLRGFWPMSSVDENSDVYDLSGQERHLTNNNGATFGLTNRHVPYVAFDGVNQYLSRADEAGLEVTAGLTLGGWFYPNSTGEAGLMTKWVESGNQQSYGIFMRADGKFQIRCSATGGDALASVHNDTPAQTGQWFHVVGRVRERDTDYCLDIFVNGRGQLCNAKASNFPIFNSTAPLEIGAYNNGNNLFNGRASLCFLSAAAIADELIYWLYRFSYRLMV